MHPNIVNAKLNTLRGLTVENTWPIENWQARTADNPDAGQYVMDGPWAKATLPFEAKAGKTVFLKTAYTPPVEAELKNSYIEFQFANMEMLLSLDGKPHAGVDWGHPRTPLPRKGRMELSLEAMSMPEYWMDRKSRVFTCKFQAARVVQVNRELEGFVQDVAMAWDTAGATADVKRKGILQQAVEDALLAVDLEAPRAELVRQVVAARKAMAATLKQVPPDAGGGKMFAVGHTHIDVAWLWPLKETVRKTGRTFATACRLMEKYPNFTFACSQAQLYRYAKDYYPALFAEIKKWVRTGRWETTGAMWVECDCNVPDGESIVRQILAGIEFFQREFGTRPRGCWLPDVFGYPASLPEILRGCGLEHFFTCKLHWQSRNGWPNHLFRWRGLDGTEILSHIPRYFGMYNGEPNPDQLIKGWDLYEQKSQYGEVLFPFGFGDGGGGVNENMMERVTRAEAGIPGLPLVKMGTSEQYFARVKPHAAKLPLWDGELYLETHRGTFTTEGPVKRGNRLCERAMREAELAASVALAGGAKLDLSPLTEAWELLLTSQFHDILPGSSVREVYEDAARDHEKIQRLANQVRGKALAAAAPKATTKATDSVCVVNSLSWRRQDVAEVTVQAAAAPKGLIGPQGQCTPVQVLSRKGGEYRLLIAPADAPSCGCAVYRLSTQHGPSGSSLKVSTTAMENRYWRIKLNRDGAISELYDKLAKRQVLAPGAVGNDLQLFQDGPEVEDAWNLHSTVGKRRYPIAGPTTVRVVEQGPLRAVVRVDRKHGKTGFRQDIVLFDNLPRIDFVTHVDWHEIHTVLKAAFPLAVRSTRATYEVQFGAIERPTHRNTPWDQEKFEVPAQKWADISEADYGVSVLNDCKYGYDALDNVLRLTLLRGTTWPDIAADQGEHDFTYSLLPHGGNWTQGGTVQAAWELNTPLTAWPVAPQSEQTAESFVQLDGAAVVVQAIKPAQDGKGIVLRLYEPYGARGSVRVQLGLPVRQVRECNLVEEDGAAVKVKDGAFEFDIAPFQVRSFRVVG